MTTSEETRMTRPAPALSEAEAARVAAFDAAPPPPEVDPVKVDAVAQAMVLEAARSGSWDAHRLAAAAIAALPPSPAEEAVEPGLNAESNGRRLAWFTDDELSLELTRRAALASPAPAPQGEHRMLPGSHERSGGPECLCGANWDHWNDRCTR